MRIIFVLSFVLLLVIVACDNSQIRDKKEFPLHLRLIAEKQEINEIIKPVNITIHNNLLIIQNDRIPGASCFYVYTLDSLEYLYSFGELGGSDEEFVSPLICRDNGSNLFYVFDQRTRKLKSFDITDTGATLKDDIRINESTGRPFQEAVMLNDSILLYLSVDNYIVSYNINAENTIDSIGFETGLNDILGSNYSQSIDFFHFTNYEDKIAIGHNFIDKLTVDACSNDGRFKLGETSIEKFVHRTYASELYDNIYRYVYMYSTSDWIFAQYSGYKFKALQPFPMNTGKRHFDFLMEVYDWNLKPKALLEFDNDFFRCVVDEKRKRIITWDFLNDFDFLLVYDYSALDE